MDRLQNLQSTGSNLFEGEAKAVLDAISNSLWIPQGRSKIAGAWRPYLEVGYHLYDVDDQKLYRSTSSLHSPSSFQTVFGKAGLSFPFGVNLEIGFSQTLSEHKISGIFGMASVQVLDLATTVYTDFVPSAVVSVGYLNTISGPTTFSACGQISLGGYHRQWMAQVAYIFQTQYSLLRESVDYDKVFLRHGVTTSTPIVAGLSLTTEVFFFNMGGTMSLNYVF